MGKLDDSITPEGAKFQYDRYLAEFYGNQARAEFEQRKGDYALRKQFDPREIIVIVEARDAAAQAAAIKFNEEGGSGDSNASAAVETEPPGPRALAAGGDAPAEAAEPVVAPAHKASPVSLEEPVLAADLALARKLTRKLDAEKGIKDNSLASPLSAPLASPAKGREDAAVISTISMPSVEERQVEQDAVDSKADGEMSHEERTHALDALLKYLWVVHGVDYYGGKEFGGLDDPQRANARRTTRPEPPTAAETAAAAAAANGGTATGEKEEKEGLAVAEGDGDETAAEGGAEVAIAEPSKKEETTGAGEDAAATTTTTTTVTAPAAPALVISDKAHRIYEGRVVRRWRIRIDRGDPLLRLLQKDRMEREITEFIDRQVVKHDDQKWGNKLSTKLFVARDFVHKHIRNKHAHVLDAERERIMDIIFYDNYRHAREEENKRQNENGGRGGRGGGFGGRGGRGRGGMHHGGAPPMMMMDPSMMMGAPIIVPTAGGMIMAPMEMMMGASGGRGGGGRGRGGGGRGGRGGGRGFGQGPVVGGPNYFDLDAPKNNRAVLDYGDL